MRLLALSRTLPV